MPRCSFESPLSVGKAEVRQGWVQRPFLTHLGRTQAVSHTGEVGGDRLQTEISWACRFVGE